MRKIFCKNPKPREIKRADLEKAETSISESNDDCMTCRCTKKRISKYLNWSGRLQNPYKLKMKLSCKKTDQSPNSEIINGLRSKLHRSNYI